MCYAASEPPFPGLLHSMRKQPLAPRKALVWLIRVGVTALFIFAASVLYRQFQQYPLESFLASCDCLTFAQLASAAGFTGVSYFLLTCYDTLAASYSESQLPYRRIAPASLASYAFCNTIGLSLLAGIAIRCSFYSAYGVSAKQVSKIVLFCVLTSWIGLITLSGVMLVIEPAFFARALRIPVHIARATGLVLIIISTVYLALNWLRITPLRVFALRVRMPGWQRAAAQIVLSGLDWMAVAAVIFCLLPAESNLSYVRCNGAIRTCATGWKHQPGSRRPRCL